MTSLYYKSVTTQYNDSAVYLGHCFTGSYIYHVFSIFPYGTSMLRSAVPRLGQAQQGSCVVLVCLFLNENNVVSVVIVIAA